MESVTTTKSRFWHDYIRPQQAEYIYDDAGQNGGLEGKHFVIAGDLNASADEGDGIRNGIATLLNAKQVSQNCVPESAGGKQNRPDSEYSSSHTASWGMRADYVIPSSSLEVKSCGVFWPAADDPLYSLVSSRKLSSDHRLVWVDINF